MTTIVTRNIASVLISAPGPGLPAHASFLQTFTHGFFRLFPVPGIRAAWPTVPTGAESPRPRESAQPSCTMVRGEHRGGKEAQASGNWACLTPWAWSPALQSHLTQNQLVTATICSTWARPSTVCKRARPFMAQEVLETSLTAFISAVSHRGADLLEQSFLHAHLQI